MKRFTDLGKEIANPYTDIKSGQLITGNAWPTDQIRVIKMKDGSFALGYDIRYINHEGKQCDETYRICISEKLGVPFVAVGIGHDFTPETCESKVDSFNYTNGGYHHTVAGQPLLTLKDGGSVPGKSVVSFINHSVNPKYFSGFYRSALLDKKGLALMVKFIEDPANREAIEERISAPTDEELEFLTREMQANCEKFLNGEISADELADFATTFEGIKKGRLMSKSPIKCDMEKLEDQYLASEDQQ